MSDTYLWINKAFLEHNSMHLPGQYGNNLDKSECTSLFCLNLESMCKFFCFHQSDSLWASKCTQYRMSSDFFEKFGMCAGGQHYSYFMLVIGLNSLMIFDCEKDCYTTPTDHVCRRRFLRYCHPRYWYVVLELRYDILCVLVNFADDVQSNLFVLSYESYSH